MTLDAFTLETTVHRIGGANTMPRHWGPWMHNLNPNGPASESISSRETSAHWVRVHFDRWTLVRPALLSAQLRLEDVNGMPLGFPRAVLVSTLPSDVPLYTNHIPADVDYGVFSVGLRIPQSVWTAEDVKKLEKADEPPF